MSVDVLRAPSTDEVRRAQVLFEEYVSGGVSDAHCSRKNLELLEACHEFWNRETLTRLSERVILHVKDRLGLCRDQGVQECLWCHEEITFFEGYWRAGPEAGGPLEDNHCDVHIEVGIQLGDAWIDYGHEPIQYHLR